MSAKHTPGPWEMVISKLWPFDLHIKGPNITLTRVAYSTKSQTLADVREAVGFDHKERDRTMRIIAQQETDARLMAAAPELLEAAKEVLHFHDSGGREGDLDEALRLTRAALAKARGEA